MRFPSMLALSLFAACAPPEPVELPSIEDTAPDLEPGVRVRLVTPDPDVPIELNPDCTATFMTIIDLDNFEIGSRSENPDADGHWHLFVGRNFDEDGYFTVYEQFYNFDGQAERFNPSGVTTLRIALATGDHSLIDPEAVPPADPDDLKLSDSVYALESELNFTNPPGVICSETGPVR